MSHFSSHFSSHFLSQFSSPLSPNAKWIIGVRESTAEIGSIKLQMAYSRGSQLIRRHGPHFRGQLPRSDTSNFLSNLPCNFPNKLPSNLPTLNSDFCFEIASEKLLGVDQAESYGCRMFWAQFSNFNIIVHHCNPLWFFSFTSLHSTFTVYKYIKFWRMLYFIIILYIFIFVYLFI